jgi:hypothetical protein
VVKLHYYDHNNTGKHATNLFHIVQANECFANIRFIEQGITTINREERIVEEIGLKHFRIS